MVEKTSMQEHLIRGTFSFLAAAVCLGMSQEWIYWGLHQNSIWKIGAGAILACFAVYESHKVWTRGEQVLGLS